MKMKNCTCIVVLFTILLKGFGFPETASAQKRSIRFEYITSDHGLTQDMVDCILLDSKGFMWFGTWNGLNRFDGYSFTVYKRDSRDPESLSGNFIYALEEDRYGNIWIGTENGLNVYLAEVESFIRHHHRDGDSSAIISDRIQALLTGTSGHLWVGTDKGLDRLTTDRAGGITAITRYLLPGADTSLASPSVSSILEDKAGNIWAGTSAGVYCINQDKKQIAHYRADSYDPSSLSSDFVYALYEDSKGRIWIGTLAGLNRLVDRDGTFTVYLHNPSDPSSLVHNTVMSITEDLEGRLLVGTLGGLSIYNESGDSFTSYTRALNSRFGLNNEFINCLLCTPDGNVWIGTERGGINKYNIFQKKFEYFVNEANNANSLSHNTVNSIYEDERFLWIGTAGGGLNRYDTSRKKFVHYRFQPGNTGGLASDFVSSLYRDNRGILWIGTWGGGLHRRVENNSGTDRFIVYQNEISVPGSLINDFVACLTEDRFSNLWIGTLGGIDRYNPQKNEFIHFEALSNGKRIERVGCLFFDRYDNLWVGTQVGLYRIRHAENGRIDCIHSTIEYFCNNPSDDESISGNYIISICPDSHGNLWFGTYGSGLNMLESDSLNSPHPRFRSYTEADGLCNNIVYGILEDDAGNLWLSTDNGLSRFNLRENVFRNYYTEDGLQSNQFYWSAVYKDTNGKMYFGSMNGMNAFYPDSIIDHFSPVRPVITDFKIFNKKVEVGKEYFHRKVLERSIAETKHVVLSYRTKEFSFEFSSLNYTEPDKIQYAYRMEGFDNNWSYVDSKRRYASYTNLKGGDYTFMVMAGFDGKWDSDPAQIKISIIPPVWEKPWFRALLTMVIFASILLYIRYRTYALKKQKHKLEHQVKERTAKIEEQKVELQAQAENLKESFLQLEKRQELIEGQKQQLEEQNTQILVQRDRLIELNKKVQRVNQQQLDFFTYISHEFRSPLTLIITPVEQLLKEIRGENLITNRLRLISKNAGRLLHLINQLMDVRKVETGKVDLKASYADLVAYVDSISRSFSALAAQREIQFKRICTGVINLYFDREIVENIVYNLLSNAFKYTPEQGLVSIELDIIPVSQLPADEVAVVDKQYIKHLGIKSYARIRVSDSGQGIPQDKIREIFGRFYRLPSSSVHRVQGSGIGLYLIREMVKTHKGLLYVRSREGEGSAFSVFLPMGKEFLLPDEIVADKMPDKQKTVFRYDTVPDWTGTTVPARKTANTVKHAGNLPLLLLVDDDDELTSFVSEFMNSSFRVLVARNGKEGFDKAMVYNPDLIISDILMPEMDGLKFCSLIKNDLRTSHIPLILLSARSEVEHYIEGLESGADDYISKPFNITLLEVKAKSLIENRRKLRTLYSQSLVPVPRELTTTRPDEAFLQKTMNIIEQNLSNPDFTVQQLALRMNVSRSLLHKKLTAIADLSAGNFITSLRLKKSALLLVEGKMNISEIAYAVGFNDPKYFSRCFRKQFGMCPSEYVNNKLN